MVGVAWSSTCTATGGTPPYNWFIPPFQTTPAGLTLNPTSGQAVTLSVTPSAAGYYNWQITALDSEPGGGIQATGYFMGQIASAATSCQTPLPVQSVSGVLAPPLGGDQDFGIQFTLVGCNRSISSATSWLTITGPTSGTTAANVVLTKYHAQANPGNTTRHGTLIISVPPSITTPVDISQDGSGCVLAINPSGVQVPTSGGKGTFTVTTTPSTCVPTFTVESPWLTLSGPVGNVYTYTATANAGAGRIGAVLFVPPGGGNQGLLFSVNQDGSAPALSVSCTRNSDAGVGLAFEVDCTASGGLPPYQFSTIGALPAGTTGAVSGATYKITGIITSSASYDFTVIATDANQQPANSRLTGFVKPAPLVISCSSAVGPASTTPFTLTCTPVAGVAPYTWNISAGALPTGLSAKQTSTGSSFTVSGTPSNAGSYAFTIQVADANSSIATQNFSGTIVSVKVTLSVTPSIVSLTYRFGDPPPQPTLLQISAAPSNVSFQVSVVNAPWLSVSSPGQTPATISLNINPSTLTPGVYNATLLISAPDATPSSLQIPVSLTLINPLPPQLSVAPHRLFLTVAEGSADLTKQIAISNLGGGSLDYSVPAPNTSWLTITNTTGHLSTAGPASLQFVIHPAGLASGAYSSQLNVASTDGTQHTTVEVDLAVEPSSPSLALSQSGVQLVAAAGAGPATSAAIQVLNTGSGTLHWTAEPAVASLTPGWLQLSAASGTAPGSTAIHIDASQLAPGLYSGRVVVKSSDSLNSPVSTSVLLTVVDPAQSPAPLAAPSGVTISGQSSTSITLTNLSSKVLSFTATASTDDATNWLSVASGPASVPARQTLSVTLNATTNTSSARRGSVRFAFDDGSFATVSVLQLPSSYCTATKLVPLFTTLPSGFAAKAGQPEALSLSLYDDCGNPISSGGVSLTFTNGDPDLALQALGSGIWTGTWVPRSNGATTVSALALSNLSGSAQISGTVAAATPSSPPLVSAIFNSASYDHERIVAPGTWISIFGSQLANSSATSLAPFPASLGGLRVTLGDQALPLLYASPTQVNVLVPLSSTPNRSEQLVVERSGSLSVANDLFVTAQLPAIYTINGQGTGQGAVLIANAEILAAATRPVKRGEYIEIYCTGLGATTNPPADGAPAPSTPPLATTVVTPTVTIGGIPAPNVVYTGLSPGQIGLYQIDVEIPAGAPSGSAIPIQIAVGPQLSNTAAIAIQ